MAKKPVYSQGQYIVRRRVTSDIGGTTPPMYYSEVFDNVKDAFFFAENQPLPPGAYCIDIEILDFDGNVVDGVIFEDC